MKPRSLTALKVVVFLLSALPLARLVWAGLESYRGTGDGLGPNPIEALTHRTGAWTLYFLLITLAVTPLRRLTHQNWIGKFRRMLGLFAFAYGTLHFATWIFDRAYVELSLDVKGVLADIAKRPFITVGTLAYLLMVPLAVTSTTGMIRRLGRRWQALHRLIYVTAILGVVHFAWLVKADLRRPLFLGALLMVALSFRAVSFYLDHRRGHTQPARR